MAADSPASRQAFLEQKIGAITVATRGGRLTDVTREVAAWLKQQGAREGLATLFMRHTSASLLIQENADPDVQVDLVSALDRLAPRNAGWVHDTEGPDDMPAHLRTEAYPVYATHGYPPRGAAGTHSYEHNNALIDAAKREWAEAAAIS